MFYWVILEKIQTWGLRIYFSEKALLKSKPLETPNEFFVSTSRNFTSFFNWSFQLLNRYFSSIPWKFLVLKPPVGIFSGKTHIKFCN